MPSKIRRIAKPAEKEVRKTDKTLDVAPAKSRRPKPTPAAIDHRRQLVGTDEPRGQSGKPSRPSQRT